MADELHYCAAGGYLVPAANWLPSTRQGPFNVILRIYGPEPAVVGGEWKMPGVERI